MKIRPRQHTRLVHQRNRKDRSCIYCGQHATSRDHVPPRLLLEKPFPINLWTVPSCIPCNNASSASEEYLLTILAHIATTPTLSEKLEENGVVHRALSTWPSKDDEITTSLVVKEDGRVWLNPDLHRVHQVIRKMAQGLYFLRYHQNIRAGDVRGVSVFPYNIMDHRPTELFLSIHSERFEPKRWHTIQHGVFSYIFVRNPSDSSTLLCVMDIHSTAWATALLPLPVPTTKRSRRIPVSQLSLWPSMAS